MKWQTVVKSNSLHCVTQVSVVYWQTPSKSSSCKKGNQSVGVFNLSFMMWMLTGLCVCCFRCCYPCQKKRIIFFLKCCVETFSAEPKLLKMSRGKRINDRICLQRNLVSNETNVIIKKKHTWIQEIWQHKVKQNFFTGLKCQSFTDYKFKCKLTEKPAENEMVFKAKLLLEFL